MAFSETYPGFDPFAGLYIGFAIVSIVVLGLLYGRRMFKTLSVLLGVNISAYLLLFWYFYDRVQAAFATNPDAQRLIFQDQPAFLVTTRVIPMSANLLFCVTVTFFVSILVLRYRSTGAELH